MIKVINFKHLFKYILIIILLTICLFLIYNYSSIGKTIDSNHDINTIFYSCLDDTIPGIEVANNKDKTNINVLTAVLASELPILNTASSTVSNNNQISSNNTQNTNITNNSNSLTYASDNAKTEIIPNNVPNTYTNDYNGVQIKNGTKYTLSDDILNPKDLNINKSNIIIFHTHTCESYTPSDAYQYEESGNFRTTNLDRSVVRVGTELTNYLLSYGYNVIHNTTYHDYPSYDGAYERSMATVQSILQQHPDTDIIMDIHRDAIADTSYAPSVKIGDDTVAQLMFVMGTDGGGLDHPGWRTNLKFAVKVQQKANELYPRII